MGEPMADSRMEDLAESECLELLKIHHFGRVAFVERDEGPPVIMPLNYLMLAETVVVRTDPRSKLGTALRDAPVSFEIDGIDQRERTGWSVVVSGWAQEIVDPEELEELHQTPLLPWAPGYRSQYVRIRPELVTGRRISVADLPSNWWG
jgi:nitroimidazol reductase NimA-like FMN-containing flavoprotein (pyridoxamine 5'-phosphate oxidase superfamily)